ncbi:hypothetical protein [Marinifilum flexuosum]|uniref:Uncharacterized protein n=1 Tax=Marinifilum flexuosum TaxID=1117708 RepID=A0A419WMV9_9BACT|nr:hypothetical protein [Marinifilum flexuosum]RKD96768.1 hypothetical protein BXY64_3715 [Marinifilum flexuosum]
MKDEFKLLLLLIDKLQWIDVQKARLTKIAETFGTTQFPIQMSISTGPPQKILSPREIHEEQKKNIVKVNIPRPEWMDELITQIEADIENYEKQKNEPSLTFQYNVSEELGLRILELFKKDLDYQQEHIEKAVEKLQQSKIFYLNTKQNV